MSAWASMSSSRMNISTRENGTLEDSTCDSKDSASTERSDANRDWGRQTCVDGA